MIDAPQDAERTKSFRQIARFSSIGIFWGVAVGIGWWFGSWLDRRFDTAPWFMVVGILVGVAAGFKEMYLTGKAAQATSRGSTESKD